MLGDIELKKIKETGTEVLVFIIYLLFNFYSAFLSESRSPRWSTDQFGVKYIKRLNILKPFSYHHKLKTNNWLKLALNYSQVKSLPK